MKKRMNKIKAVEIGRLVVAVIEAVFGPNMPEEALNFCQMHRRCEDWFEHPDWPDYMIIINRVEEVLEIYW